MYCPRYGGGQGREFSTWYSLEYWRAGAWRQYSNSTGGRSGAGVGQGAPPPGWSRATRTHTWPPGTGSCHLCWLRGYASCPTAVTPGRWLLLLSSHLPTLQVCLRVEIHGCPYLGPLLSYSAPRGGHFSNRLFTVLDTAPNPPQNEPDRPDL